MTDTNPDDLSCFLEVPYSVKNCIAVEQLDTSVADAQNREEHDTTSLAQSIWDSGMAFLFMYRSCSDFHTGDVRIIKIMLLSFAATKILNSYGMHVTVTGDAGTGKSHVATIVSSHLPKKNIKAGRMSDKALFHHKFEPGCVYIQDDQSPSEDMQEIIKESTTNFHLETVYYSVKNNTAVELTIPAESVFWLIKVEIVGDEQVQDRMFNLRTDNSTAQLDAIKQAIIETAKNPGKVAYDLSNQIISQRIWELVPKAYVSIPFADYIDNEERPEARNLNLFCDLIRASAMIHAPIRPRSADINGYPCIEATYHDFIVACRLMNPLMSNRGGSQKLRTDGNQQDILNYLESHYTQTTREPIPVSTIREALKIKPALMTFALNGRTDRGTEGLCNICPALEVVPMTVPNQNGRGTHNEKGIIWNYNMYVSWKGSGGCFTIDLPDDYIKPILTDAEREEISDFDADDEQEQKREQEKNGAKQ